jgi:hypothetical protein
VYPKQYLGCFKNCILKFPETKGNMAYIFLPFTHKILIFGLALRDANASFDLERMAPNTQQ